MYSVKILYFCLTIQLTAMDIDVLWRIGERLLRWGTRVHCTVMPSVYPSYNRKQYACPIEQNYHAAGPYAVTYHAIDGTHAFIPDVAQEQAFPLVVMVNGTGLKALDYAPVFEHLASWGFVVIGNDDTSAWNGRSALTSLDIALQHNDSKTSPLYHRIDLQRMGVAGHSQGAIGAINAASADKRFRVLYAASCPQAKLAKRLRWTYSLDGIHVPTMLSAGTWWIERQVSPLASLERLAGELPASTPMLMGRINGIEHRYVLHQGDAYMTAWLRYWLANDTLAAPAFLGTAPEILNNPRWIDVKIALE